MRVSPCVATLHDSVCWANVVSPTRAPLSNEDFFFDRPIEEFDHLVIVQASELSKYAIRDAAVPADVLQRGR